jgi:hypothetical protein
MRQFKLPHGNINFFDSVVKWHALLSHKVRIVIVPAPVWFHYVLAQIFEWTMRVPLIAKAQVRILSEGVVEAAPACDRLPGDLMPTRLFTDEPIREGLPHSGAFSIRDLRCSRA